MKKLLMLFFLCCAPMLRSQEKIPITIESVEKEIDAFISKEIKTYKLPKEIEMQFIKNYQLEAEEHGFQSSESELKESLLGLKKFYIRKDFFNSNPKKREVYKQAKGANNMRQICSDGGFEDNVMTPKYEFTTASPPTNGVSVNVVTTGGDFTPPFPPTGLNDFNARYTLVSSPGTDPTTGLNRVFNGNRAIKLGASNSTGINSGYQVTRMTRRFTVNESFINFNYLLILQNPGHFPLTNQPFFTVRLRDTLNNILDQIDVVSNAQDCRFTGLNNNSVLHTGWVCDRFDTSNFIGEELIIEFVIADCAPGAHFGTVYIDEICNTNCANPLSGSIKLNSIPTSICPTTTQTICGTYQLPVNSQYGNISLNITQNGVVIASIPSPSTLKSNEPDVLFYGACFSFWSKSKRELRISGAG